MSFINPTHLFLLILVPIAILFLVWRNRVRNATLLRLGDPPLLSRLIPFRRNRWLEPVLWLVALASLVIALARPVWGEDVSIVETQGVSVMVVLDVSKSMNAQDMVPSRLQAAKLAISDLFTGLAGNELGMVLFAGTAFVQFPLTVDTASAMTFFNAASSDAITRQGTNIDAALRLAMDSFHDFNSSQKLIILMTDGENHEGDPLAAAMLALDQDITIYTIGYGSSEGSPIPIRDANGNEIGYQMDRAGNLVLSALDETTLRDIAERTGGIYQQATSTGLEISNLLDTINKVETANLGMRTKSQGIERFGIFVLLALAALALDIWLPQNRRNAA